jgi:tRNA-modifying protein YgfZ
MANSAVLSDRAIIAVEGPEARDFLQGLITNDIATCRVGQAIYAALLTPQGKILFDFLITQDQQQYLVDCAGASAADLMKRLGFYRLRANVQIAARPELLVAAVWGDPLPSHYEGVIAYPDPRLPLLGARVIGTQEKLEAAIASFARGDYDFLRVSAGIPDSADLPPDQVFALDAALEELHGVSFSKGCYVGQEVTARMKHRATARRRFYVAEAKLLPKPGTVIQADGRELGRLANGANGRALALVRLDRLAEAEHSRIEADGQPILLRKPEWLHD